MAALEPLLVVAAAAMGLLFGALLTEGALLVPHWKSLDRQAFHVQRDDFGPRLFGFFAPLTIGASLLGLTGALAALAVEGSVFAVGTGIVAVVLVLFYFFFFAEANQKLADRSLSDAEHGESSSEVADCSLGEGVCRRRWFHLLTHGPAFLLKLLLSGCWRVLGLDESSRPRPCSRKEMSSGKSNPRVHRPVSCEGLRGLSAGDQAQTARVSIAGVCGR